MMRAFSLRLAAGLFVTLNCAVFGGVRFDSVTNFDKDASGKLPDGWKAEGTNQTGPVATWQVMADPSTPSGPNVLALSKSNHESSSTFNLCWTDQVRFHEGSIEVAFKAITGKVDQGGGPIWRVQDVNNYYICRANPLEGNFRLYVVKDGSRKQLADAKVSVAAGQWHRIKVEHVGTHITCWVNGTKSFEADDTTFTEPGGVGVWTKADAVTSFDNLHIAQGATAIASTTGAIHSADSKVASIAGKRMHEEPPLAWVSTPTSIAPEIDGVIDAAWASATALIVTVREAVGAGSPRTVTLRALHTADTLYVLAEWEDDTRSDKRDPYIWNKDTSTYDRPTRPDDQFALQFPISGEFDVSMLAMGKAFTADVWHWKAGRGGPVGFVDDKRHLISAEPMEKATEYSFGPHGKVFIQRPMDAGTHAYAVKPKPAVFEGDEVDSFVQQQPAGSVADIRGKGAHNGRGWTLEMARRFDTGHADDAVIHTDRANPCAIAILDDELYWHHSVSPLIHLTFGSK